MSRFLSWLALGVAAAFLVVARVSFSSVATADLAFGISIGTLIVAAGVGYLDRTSVASVYTAALIALISAWTIVASLVFSRPTVQNLALGASLAIGGLAVVGLTVHEVTVEHAARSVKAATSEPEGRLAAAA
jgi:hypothetical protein